MKKIIIVIPVILIILGIIITIVINENHKRQELNIKNIKVTTETFTLTDNGTEIEAKLQNKNDDQIELKKIEASLYDSDGKKIVTLEYKKKTKIAKEKIIKITSKKKYPNTSNIKYKVFN